MMKFSALFPIITIFMTLWMSGEESIAAPTQVLARYGIAKYDPIKDTHFSYRDPNVPKGGRVRIGTISTFDSLNMFSVKGISSEGIPYTMASLMRRSAHEPFTLYVHIAESVDLAPDHSKVTFKINPKATFSDGSPVTAADVKFTMEILRDKGLPRYKNHLNPKKLKEIVVEDPHTVTFKWLPDEHGGYDPEMSMVVAMIPILSNKQLENVDFFTFSQTPLLTAGPYKVKTVEFGKRLVLERIQNYWGEDLFANKGSGNFDEVEVISFKNPNAHFQAFLAGDIDIYFEQDINQWNTRYDVPCVKEGRIKRLEMNHTRPVTVRTIAFNMRRKKFTDLRVRKALDLAFDFETLNRLVFYGSLKRAKSLFEHTTLAHRGAISEKERALLAPHKELIQKHIEHNLLDNDVFDAPYTPNETKGDGNQRDAIARADALLTEAGWILQNGKRVHKSGQSAPLEFEFLLKDPRLEKVALAYQRSLGFLGIKLSIRMVDAVQYEDRTSNRDFDMIVHSWSNSLCPGAEQMYYFGIQAADHTGSSNYIGSKDVLLENLAKDVMGATNYEDLTARVHNLDRFVMHSHIMIPVSFDNTACVAYNTSKIMFPEIDPLVGVSLIDTGYASSTKPQENSPFSHAWKWLQTLFVRV